MVIMSPTVKVSPPTGKVMSGRNTSRAALEWWTLKGVAKTAEATMVKAVKIVVNCIVM